MKIAAVILGVIVLAFLGAWLWVRGPDIPDATLEAKYTDGSTRFADLPGGFHVHYQEDGDPALPTLVLLHGYGDSYTSWQGWVKELRGRFHVISLDFPGHGLTRAPDDYRLRSDGLAEFVDAFARQLNLPKFALAGNSMGGGVAWQFALRNPERLNALILVDAAGFPNEKPPDATPLAFKILRYPLGRMLLRHIDNRPLIDQGLKTDVYDPSLITAALVDRWAEFQRAPGHRAILMGVDPTAFNQASAGLLHDIDLPTLILQGESDVVIEPKSAQKFAAAIPHSTLITYPKVGHLPQIEIPQRSAADVAQFLSASHAP